MIKTYISKPEEITAIQLSADEINEIMTFSDNSICRENRYWGFVNNGFSMQFKDGDYAFKRNGEPCSLMKKSQFEKMYIQKD